MPFNSAAQLVPLIPRVMGTPTGFGRVAITQISNGNGAMLTELVLQLSHE